jgi:hypothetical protein
MTLRTVAFGDLESGLWGTFWDLGDPGGADPDTAIALLGARGSPPAHARVELSGSGDGEGWKFSADGVELQCAPEGEAARVDGGFDQLARMSGRFAIGGSEHAVDCLGHRVERDSLELSRFDSVRDVSALFDPDLGLTVLVARPRGSSSHDEDLISASVFEEGVWRQVAAPRLSTTYTTAGLPTRASFELWVEQASDGDQDAAGEHGEAEETVRQHPRRAAGEAVGSRGSFSDGPLELRAELFRWHARGREGAGVYALARLQQG